MGHYRNGMQRRPDSKNTLFLLCPVMMPSDGSDPFRITKAVGVRRIDTPEEESEPALYEFYNVFPRNTLQAGNAYDVTVQAYDRQNAAIPGAVCTFMLNC